MYVNIAGGTRDCSAISEAKTWLEEHGYGVFVTHGVVPGPLLRATMRGNPKRLTHMPLKPGSSYAHVPKALQEAYELNRAAGVVDPEEDLAGQRRPIMATTATAVTPTRLRVIRWRSLDRARVI